MDEPLLQRAASDHALPQFSTLSMQNSILVSGRMGRLQESDRIMAFTDAILAIICTSCAVPLWANGTRNFNPVRLVPFVTTFFILVRLWEKHCQDFIRLKHVDEKLPQINVLWIASLTLLPFSFVVLFVPTTPTGHLTYLGLWVVVLLLVGGTSHLISSAARRLSPLRPEDREYKGWVGRDKTLSVSLLQVGLVIIGASLVAWEEHLDILTDDYKKAFRPGHVRTAAVVWVVGLLVFWAALAGRLNFQLVQVWWGTESPVLFEGAVPRVRVEIFSDGVYAASATGLMIELLNGLLHNAQEGEGEGGSEEGEGKGPSSVWPGLINYIYCFHTIAVLHRSHQNIVAKVPAFRPALLAINCLVCLSVAFIPTLSTILDVSWHHDPASLTTAAAFLLCASLLLVLLLTAALRAAPLVMEASGIHESAEALLSEMLGRPFESGAGILSGRILANEEEDNEDEEDDEEGGPFPGHVPRLFQDPSCLPRGMGVDAKLLLRLQAIRDEYEVSSAFILPVMALFLTLLTASFQLVGLESDFMPVAFLLTFFVYTVEHRLLRPRAAKQIRRIQRELRQQQHAQHQLSRSHLLRPPPAMLSTLQTVREESSFTFSGEDAEEEKGGETKEETPPPAQGQDVFEKGDRENEFKEEGLARRERPTSLSSGSNGEGEKHVHFEEA